MSYSENNAARSFGVHCRSGNSRLAALSTLLILAGLAAPASGQTEAPKLETQVQTGTTPAVSAAETAAKEGTAAAAVEESGPKLNVAFAPFVWLTSFSGSTTVGGITTDVDESFIDILDASDEVFGLMGALDLEYNRWVFQFNGAWSTADFSDQRSILRNGELDAKIESNMAWLELFAGYRFIDKPIGDDAASHRRFALDGFVGGRVTLMDVKETFTASVDIELPDGTVLGRSASRSDTEAEDWFEPFIGARMMVDLSEGWTLNLRGDIGGFGWGSDFAWQGIGLIGYTWRYQTWNLTAFGGVRALGQDYSSGDFGWDMITYGPILGVAFTW